jgi:hypothetical protein
VYRSPNAMTAFKEAGKIMRTIADGTVSLRPYLRRLTSDGAG